MTIKQRHLVSANLSTCEVKAEIGVGNHGPLLSNLTQNTIDSKIQKMSCGMI